MGVTIVKVKACPFCETTITTDKLSIIPESCSSCGKELNPKEMLILDIKETSNYVSAKNTIASVLKGLGWVTIIFGVIVGIIIAINNNSYLSSFYLIGGIISGLFMLGFSEIIILLHKINLKIK